MRAIDKQAKITDIIRHQSRATVAALALHFSPPAETIRCDLTVLNCRQVTKIACCCTTAWNYCSSSVQTENERTDGNHPAAKIQNQSRPLLTVSAMPAKTDIMDFRIDETHIGK